MAICRHEEEKKQLQMKWDEEKAHVQEELRWNMRWHSGLGWSRWRKALTERREKLIQMAPGQREKVRA